MSWISGSHSSFRAERVWASCTLSGNQALESPALCWSRAAPLHQESWEPGTRCTKFLSFQQTPCPGSGSALNVCLEH